MRPYDGDSPASPVNEAHDMTTTDSQLQEEQKWADTATQTDDSFIGLEVDIESYRKVVPATPQAAPEEEDELDDDGYTFPNGLKFALIILAFIATLLVIVLPLYFTQWDNRREVSSGGETGLVAESTTSAPTLAPTLAPTATLSEAPSLSAYGYLMQILSPHTAMDLLVDSAQPQGQAFNDLLRVEEGATQRTPPFRVLQRYALMVLYYSTTPSGWSSSFGWSTFAPDECNWFGVNTCRQLADGNLAVTNLGLATNGLLGSIPSEICLLDASFEQLDLESNILVGMLPSCLFEFRQLKRLVLKNNFFTGGLPRGLLTVPTLQTVNLADNRLTGSMDVLFQAPASIAGGESSASSLARLGLNNNALTGTVPVDLANFASLTFLNLEDNSLTGMVDAGICGLTTTLLRQFSVDCAEVNCTCCTNCL